MEKINVAELLKDCPSGMELDCTMFENTQFINVEEDDKPICIRTEDIYRYLTKFGTWTFDENAKCVIFPKGKTTWEGFVPPCQFKDGDIIFTRTGNYNWVSIFKQLSGSSCCTYVDLCMNDNDLLTDTPSLCNIEDIYIQCLATEDEKRKLFDTIKADGYKWNPETKTLEKLIEPKFKVGDRIKLKTCSSIYTITDLLKDKYRATIHSYDLYEIEFERQDAYELVPNKFDINILVPFESKVLVRHNRDNKWCGSFFSHIDEDFHSHCYRFVTTSGRSYPMCIPYEGNEHILGKTDDCDEYFKTWKLWKA